MIRNRIKDLVHIRAGDLKADPRNWRRHPANQQNALETVLKEVGYADAVIARETDEGLTLIDGHLRAGLDPDQIIPVLITDLDDGEAGQVLATLDPLASMAYADNDALQTLLDDTGPESGADFRNLLSDIHDWQDITETRNPDATPDVPTETTTERGDMWILGNHRLLCGDANDAEDVATLLDGVMPTLLVTDPPYGVNYDPKWRVEEANKGTIAFGPETRTGPIPNDDSPEDWATVLDHCKPDVAYVWSPGGDHMLTFGQVIKDAGYQIRNLLIWRKPSIAISRGHYNWQHEVVWYAVKRGATAHWQGTKGEPTIWDISRDNIVSKETGGHSEQKPVECMERPIRNHKGDVYDPFVGSGTTIIAAERQDRACFAMEIEPHYIDVCVQRWEEYTGETGNKVPAHHDSE